MTFEPQLHRAIHRVGGDGEIDVVLTFGELFELCLGCQALEPGEEQGLVEVPVTLVNEGLEGDGRLALRLDQLCDP